MNGFTLDTRDQGAYRDLLRSTLEVRDSKPHKKLCVPHQPVIGAAINYMQYRLALGVMEPAVDIALRKTEPEHTRVRIVRTIVAANMVRGWMLDSFADTKHATRVPGLIDQDVEGYVRQYLTEEYHRADEGLADKYLDDGAHLIPLDRQADEYRLFDISDFTRRLLYSPGDQIISSEELEALLEKARAQPSLPVNRKGVTAENLTSISEPLTDDEKAFVRRQIMGRACAGLGLLTVQRSSDGKTVPAEELPAREKLLPGLKLNGRQVAYEEAVKMLRTMLKSNNTLPGITNKRVKPEVVAKVRRRLASMVTHYGRTGLPVDVAILLGDEEYRAIHGDEPTRRDWWSD